MTLNNFSHWRTGFSWNRAGTLVNMRFSISSLLEWRIQLQRPLAIKTIRQHLLEGKSGHDLLERFRREARAEGKLVRPHIIMIHDY
jgi:hypothetical protein